MDNLETFRRKLSCFWRLNVFLDFGPPFLWFARFLHVNPEAEAGFGEFSSRTRSISRKLSRYEEAAALHSTASLTSCFSIPYSCTPSSSSSIRSWISKLTAFFIIVGFRSATSTSQPIALGILRKFLLLLSSNMLSSFSSSSLSSEFDREITVTIIKISSDWCTNYIFDFPTSDLGSCNFLLIPDATSKIIQRLERFQKLQKIAPFIANNIMTPRSNLGAVSNEIFRK